MSTTSKILTVLIFGAIFGLIMTHPAGFAADSLAGGSVLDNTLSIESGAGRTGGTKGTFSTSPGSGFTVG